MNRAIHVCLEDFQDIAPPSRIKMYCEIHSLENQENAFCNLSSQDILYEKTFSKNVAFLDSMFILTCISEISNL